MAEVGDRHDATTMQLVERLVRERPVVAPITEPGPVQRRTVAQEPDPEILHAVEVLPPLLVMAALRQLVDRVLAALDRRVAVLDPGREHEA